MRVLVKHPESLINLDEIPLSCEIWVFPSEHLAISEGKQGQKRDFGVEIYPKRKFQVQFC